MTQVKINIYVLSLTLLTTGKIFKNSFKLLIGFCGVDWQNVIKSVHFLLFNFQFSRIKQIKKQNKGNV